MDNKDRLKHGILKEKRCLNNKAKDVEDKLFKKYDFFDPNDLIQVKYEMIRRVKKDGWTIARASKTFGFSRPSFYKAQKTFENQGLIGFIPGKRGPKEARKLTDNIMEFVEQSIKEKDKIRANKLAVLIKKHFGFKVHRRSIERALKRRKKKQ